MRAVAVLSVFLFHLQPSLLPGGFLGVDVFFVISGYLITGIIVRENHLGTFSLSNFYGRRVKRIFPALFVLLALASVFATFLLTPETYVRYMQSARYASGQLSNFLFAQKVGYFEEGFSGQPLLHTWSLGVEEQFYLVWPLLIYLVFRLSRSWFAAGATMAHEGHSAGMMKRIMGGVLVLLFLASYLLCQYLAGTNANLSFYMFFTRAFEFSIGGFLCLGLIRQPESSAAHTVIGIGGLVLLVTSFLAVRQEFFGNSFLRYGTLLACFGTGMIIFSSPAQSIVNRLLASRLPAAVGRISYSLYLYHWPLLIFWKVYSGEDSLSFTSCLIIITVAFVLSILSYRYVEQPARKTTLPDRWVLCSALTVIIVFAVSFRLLEEEDTSEWRISRYTKVEDDSQRYSLDCPRRPEKGMMVFNCSDEPKSSRPAIALVGDSHSGHYFPAVAEWARQNNYELKFLGVPGCPILVGDVRIKSFIAEEHAGQCEKALSTFARGIIANPNVEVVVMAQRFDLFLDGISYEGENSVIRFLDPYGEPILQHSEYFQERLQETVLTLKENGKGVVLAGQVPLFRQVKECDWRPRLMNQQDWQRVCSYDHDFIETWQHQSRSFIQGFARDNQVFYFDPFPHFEEPVIGGLNLYRDVDHLSNRGELHMAPFVAEELDRARLKSF
ncbi:MAG: acyltransferase [Desulfofustis sp.]|nr:acyltransferase [Desulfofustis sp.]